MANKHTLKPGYAFAHKTWDFLTLPAHVPNDLWETVVISAGLCARAEYVSGVLIDDTDCAAFRDPETGTLYAQGKVLTRNS